MCYKLENSFLSASIPFENKVSEENEFIDLFIQTITIIINLHM